MSRSSGFHRADPAVLESLRRRIRGLEGAFCRGEDGGILGLGAPALDEALPWGGLPRAALHEVLAADGGAAAGFCAGLLSRLAGGTGTVLWCRYGYGRRLYGPGLAAFGLDPARLIVVRGRNATDVLWVMEEALRSGALAGVLGEAEGLSVTAARRLQLAAEGNATAALLLRVGDDGGASPAVTRWRVAAAPGGRAEGRPGVGRPRWRVDLLKCRNTAGAAAGGSRSWLVEWTDGTDGTTAGGFAVVAGLRDRPAEPAASSGNGAAALRLAG
jgi:protein ImuA